MAVTHSGGDVDVASGTGYSSTTGKATPIVQLTVNPTGLKPAFIHLRPVEARAIGLDLIATASQAIADTALRQLAREHGADSDGYVSRLRDATREELGEG